MHTELWIMRISKNRNLRKLLTFCDAITGFPSKWRLRNERRNSILMTCHYPGLGSALDWSCSVGNLLQPIVGTTQFWIVSYSDMLSVSGFALFLALEISPRPFEVSHDLFSAHFRKLSKPSFFQGIFLSCLRFLITRLYLTLSLLWHLQQLTYKT